jgi:hypothetical protein
MNVATSRSSDLTRQIAVLAATGFMLVAAMVGTGLFGGTAVQDLQDGALDADASYLAPARQAFSIWSAVYLGLIAYAVWQALPGQRASERQRRLGWLIAVTEVLNGLWLVAAQFTTLPLTVLVIVLLLVALSITWRRAIMQPSEGVVSAVLIDGVTGLHLGWVTLATVANTAAWLTRILPAGAEDAADVWGVVVLVAVAAIGCGIAWFGRVAPSLALCWGPSWLAVGRLTDQPHSAAIGTAAVGAAALVALVTVVRVVQRLRRG